MLLLERAAHGRLVALAKPGPIPAQAELAPLSGAVVARRTAAISMHYSIVGPAQSSYLSWAGTTR